MASLPLDYLLIKGVHSQTLFATFGLLFLLVFLIITTNLNTYIQLYNERIICRKNFRNYQVLYEDIAQIKLVKERVLTWRGYIYDLGGTLSGRWVWKVYIYTSHRQRIRIPTKPFSAKDLYILADCLQKKAINANIDDNIHAIQQGTFNWFAPGASISE